MLDIHESRVASSLLDVYLFEQREFKMKKTVVLFAVLALMVITSSAHASILGSFLR